MTIALAIAAAVLVIAALTWKRGVREEAPDIFVRWSCHFCDLVRPDPRISVATRRREIRPGLVMNEHRRYCNDSPACIDSAFAWVGELEHAEL